MLDQRWYTFKRFGQYQDTIFSASQIVFYGGLENDVRANLPKHYESVVPLEKDQEPGEIRLFSAKHAPAQHDLIIIGQNGREVALKTIIRLIYLASFADASANGNIATSYTRSKNPSRCSCLHEALGKNLLIFLLSTALAVPTR